ncbi:MAG: protein NO VEIN domain-containing protein [Sporichthyaceae bacterium]
MSPEVLDGYPNYHHVTCAPDAKRLTLYRGINAPALVGGGLARRRPLISLRSTTWNAGGDINLWHDEFDLEHGRIRYFGDHRPSTVELPGEQGGNRTMLEAWDLHASLQSNARSLAPPLLLWRSPVGSINGKHTFKGYVEFCGLAVVEQIEHVQQMDVGTARTFPNIAFDLVVLELPDDELDARFVDDRRDPSLTADEALRHAPDSWREWVESGRSAFRRIRRRSSAGDPSAAASNAADDVVEDTALQGQQVPRGALTRIQDPVLRKAVENHAVDRAIEHYTSLGATDIEVLGKPYDLKLRLAGQELHVEVKGSSLAIGTVELTANEVSHARDHQPTALVVVDGIVWTRSSDGTIATAGGRTRVWSNWEPDDESLRPRSYAYTLPSNPVSPPAIEG